MATRNTFVAVARERVPAWRRTAYLMCGDWARAEDLVQTALLRMYLKWHRIDPGGVDAYARRVIMRLAIDESRRPHRRSEVSGEVPDRAAESTDLAAGMDVRTALAQLPPRQRATIVLRFYHQLSVAETADALGVGQGTVKSQTAKGLDRMRALLGVELAVSVEPAEPAASVEPGASGEPAGPAEPVEPAASVEPGASGEPAGSTLLAKTPATFRYQEQP